MSTNRTRDRSSSGRFCDGRVMVALVMFLSTFSDASLAANMIKARSISVADVDSAIASASDGDTVVLPTGTASWTSTVVLTKGITIEGAGNDKTVILDDIPVATEPRQRTADRSQGKPSGPMHRSARPGSLPGQPGGRGNSAQSIFRIEMTPHQSFRLTGITFRPGSVVRERGGGQVPHSIVTQGTCSSFRIDHCHFDQLYRSSIHINGWMYGVIDHCVFDSRARGSASILVQHTNWGGKTFGDGSWTEPPYFGSEKFVFIEDNIFNNLGSKQTNGSIDCSAGGRYVCRYNTFNNCLALSHGTESSGRLRSSRAVEIYNNTFHFTFPASAGQFRGGTAVIHDNTYTGVPISRGITLQVFREFYPFHVFGGANGTNPWDVNDSHGLYASGKHTGENASKTLVVANAGWKTNQWVGYSLTNTTQTLRNGEHYSSFITSNTNDTITYKLDDSIGPRSQGTFMSFNTGDGYEIHKVSIALDQPGRGKGDLISGNPPGPVGWPHQALEPVYSWNNKMGDSEVNISGGLVPTLQESRDYYNNTPMPGYKPYAYPHPLVSGETSHNRKARSSASAEP